MLICIDSSPCSLSLRNRSTLCSTTKCHQNNSDLNNFFVQKSFFFNIFYSFNPNHAYWNQRQLFSGNLPGMFLYFFLLNFHSNLRKEYVGVKNKFPKYRQGGTFFYLQHKDETFKQFLLCFSVKHLERFLIHFSI